MDKVRWASECIFRRTLKLEGRLISLCMIVRDEERRLPTCLESVRGLFTETVVVDTGSTDGTQEIARAYGARVFDLPWEDDFAGARNHALERAEGDWIMRLDADEFLDEGNRARLAGLLSALPNGSPAYLMRQLSGPDADGSCLAVDQIRLFRRLPGVRWEGRTHEDLAPSFERLGIRPTASGICIAHTGYGDPLSNRAKALRNLAPLRRDLAENPDNPFFAFCLGACYLDLGDPGNAIPYLENAWGRFEPSRSIVGHVCTVLARAYRAAQRANDAIRVCEAWPASRAPDPTVFFELALAYRDAGHWDRAEQILKSLVDLPAPQHTTHFDLGILGVKGLYALGTVYWGQGKLELAEQTWRHMTGRDPHCWLGWKGLGIVALAKRNWEQVEAAARRIEGLPRGAAEAAELRFQALFAQGRYADARRQLDAGRTGENDSSLELLRARCLLGEGEFAAAEPILENVLRLEPHNREAQHNLSVLRRKRTADQGPSRPSP